MHHGKTLAALFFAFTAATWAAPVAAYNGKANIASAQSRACSAKARAQGAGRVAENKFKAACLKGALSPKRPATSVTKSDGAEAVISPSGARNTTRSEQCNGEAAKRGLHDSAFQAFRKGCLASAAPVTAIETSLRATKPTAAKPKLESLTNTPPK